MNKLKTIYICLIIPFFVLIALTFLKIEHKEEFQQKTVLAQEIRKALDHLMFDLPQVHENSIPDVPADGRWHNHLAFDSDKQGALEYLIKDGQLLRINKGKTMLIADNISSISLRRQVSVRGILELRIEARNNVSLVSNLKIRIRE